jgi:hypothetical protein
MFEVLFVYPKAGPAAADRERSFSRIALTRALHVRPCCVSPGDYLSSRNGSMSPLRNRSLSARLLPPRGPGRLSRKGGAARVLA